MSYDDWVDAQADNYCDDVHTEGLSLEEDSLGTGEVHFSHLVQEIQVFSCEY